MEFTKFQNIKWTKSKAYIIGLTLPRLDIVIIEGQENYFIAGTIAHQRIENAQLIEHIFALTKMLNQDGLSADFPIFYNNNVKYLKSNSKLRNNGKKGFIIGLDTNISVKSGMEYIEINKKFNSHILDMAAEIPDQYINDFVAGTIDGRSSIDKSRHLVAIDIDRDEIKQQMLKMLISKSSVTAEINSRKNRSDSTKSDQLRYDKKSMTKLLDIGLLSIKRLDDIKTTMKKDG